MSAGPVIENPLSGERITIRPTAAQTRPALAMQDLLETAAALARDQHAAARTRLAELALFMRDFEREVAAPVLPGLLRLATRLLARLASARGPGRRYRRLRDSAWSRSRR